MDIYGNLNLNNNALMQAVFAPEEDWPNSPTPGRFLFRNKRLFFCVELDNGLPVWMPLSQEISLYVHTQTEPSTAWSINHGFGISTVIIQILDATNKSISPDYIDLSSQDLAQVMFSAPQTGKAVVMAGALSGTAKVGVAYSQDFEESDTWVVAHGLGYYPEISVYINNRMVQPLSITHDSTVQATVRFTTLQTGTVRCG